MQIYLLNRRFQQHQEIIWRGRSAVQDRTIYEDSIFAKMLAESGPDGRARLPDTYSELFRHMSNFMCKPNVIVYLDVDPELSLERIRPRGRDIEGGVSLEYLRALHEGYEAFVADISRVIPVIRVDYDRFATAEEMAQVIRREYLDHSFLRRGHPLRPDALADRHRGWLEARVEGIGQPGVDVGLGEPKGRRHDSDHGAGNPVGDHGLADDAGVAAEAELPETMAQDRQRLRALCVFAFAVGASELVKTAGWTRFPAPGSTRR